MSQVKSQISRIKSAFHETQEIIDKYSDTKNYTQLTNQLKSIEKSIQLLKKQETPIPDELRKLKMELLDSLDNFTALEHLKKVVLQLSKEFIAKNKPRRKSKTSKKKADNNNNSVQGNLFSDL